MVESVRDIPNRIFILVLKIFFSLSQAFLLVILVAKIKQLSVSQYLFLTEERRFHSCISKIFFGSTSSRCCHINVILKPQTALGALPLSHLLFLFLQCEVKVKASRDDAGNAEIEGQPGKTCTSFLLLFPETSGLCSNNEGWNGCPCHDKGWFFFSVIFLFAFLLYLFSAGEPFLLGNLELILFHNDVWFLFLCLYFRKFNGLYWSLVVVFCKVLNKLYN